jgi:arylsulfatase
MYGAYTAAHWPIQAREKAIVEYHGKYDAGYDAIRQQRMAKQRQLGLIANVATPAPTTGDWEAVKDKSYEGRRMETFAAMITRMDQGIGRIIAHLESSGQLDNTLVLYLHDNGGCDEEFFHNNQQPPKNLHAMAADELQTHTLPPMQTRDGNPVRTGEGVLAGPAESFVGYGPAWANVSNTPLRLVKKNTHEGGISTPLVVHWPMGVDNGQRPPIATPAHVIDLMPTILEVAAASYPEQFHGQAIQPMEGESLVPLITHSGKLNRESPLFWEHEGNRAVRRGRWKLVSLENAAWELYDIDQDRGEMRNLAEEHPELVAELAAEWEAYAKRAKVEPYGAHRLREAKAPQKQRGQQRRRQAK